MKEGRRRIMIKGERRKEGILREIRKRIRRIRGIIRIKCKRKVKKNKGKK